MLPAQEPGLVAIQTTDIENVCNSKPNTRRETTNDMGRNLCNTEKADRCGCFSAAVVFFSAAVVFLFPLRLKLFL